MDGLDRKMIARLVLVLLVLGIGALVSAQTPLERRVRVHNARHTEVRELEIRWAGGKAGWVRVSAGKTVEALVRSSAEGFLELSFKDSQGLPVFERRERVIHDESPQTLELRLLRDGGVYWPTLAVRAK